jgi:hypothetical protein
MFDWTKRNLILSNLILLLTIKLLFLSTSCNNVDQNTSNDNSDLTQNFDSSILVLQPISLDTTIGMKCGSAFAKDSNSCAWGGTFFETDFKGNALIKIKDTFVFLRATDNLGIYKNKQNICSIYNGNNYAIKIELRQKGKIEKFLTSYIGKITITKDKHTKILDVYGGIWCDK